MSTFILTLDLGDHEHRHSPMAQRQFVVQMLQQASQQIGSGYVDPRIASGAHGVTRDHHSIGHAQGDIVHNGGGAAGTKTIGNWRFIGPGNK